MIKYIKNALEEFGTYYYISQNSVNEKELDKLLDKYAPF
jgi:hypothetical protein